LSPSPRKFWTFAKRLERLTPIIGSNRVVSAEIYLRAQRLLNIATPGEYRALVADISLRGRTDGWEVAQRAREIDPNFPVVYINGASASAGVWRQKAPHSVLEEALRTGATLHRSFQPSQQRHADA
jgi:DNA-binding LytR/AlgR family response regulator